MGVHCNLIQIVCHSYSGVTSLKCNEGSSGIHGFPLEIEPAECDAGVVNCAKIRGSKYSTLVTMILIFHYPAIDAESVQAWSCGLKTEQSNCVSGIPDGVPLDVGETVADAITCFCTGDLCNGEHFCDACVADSGVGRIAASILATFIMAIMI